MLARESMMNAAVVSTVRLWRTIASDKTWFALRVFFSLAVIALQHMFNALLHKQMNIKIFFDKEKSSRAKGEREKKHNHRKIYFKISSCLCRLSSLFGTIHLTYMCFYFCFEVLSPIFCFVNISKMHI